MNAVHSAIHTLVNDPTLGPAGHTAATGAILASVAGWLTPPLTALATILAICWYAVTLYETKTVQNMIARFKERRAKK